jgi:multiple sugar transport system permease protein
MSEASIDRSAGRHLISYAQREWVAGYAFASPWIIGFLAFTLYPIFMSLYYSLCRYDVLRPAMFVGLDNYRYLLFENPRFWRAVGNTLYFTALRVPLVIAGSLILALLVYRPMRGINALRTIYYLPSIISGVALSLIWMWMYNPKFGLVNQALLSLGVPGPLWLEDPKFSKLAIVLMGIWSIGGGRMIILVAGLNSVPVHLYESARVDGAGRWSQFWHITLPQLSGVLFLLTVVEVIGAFQVFVEAYLMTNGGPLDSTLFYNFELFNRAFREYEMGTASAMAWLLFVLTLAVTALLFRYVGRRVYYEGER